MLLETRSIDFILFLHFHKRRSHVHILADKLKMKHRPLNVVLRSITVISVAEPSLRYLRFDSLGLLVYAPCCHLI